MKIRKSMLLAAWSAATSCGLASIALATPFVREIADASGNIAYYTSLAIDAQGRPHISAYDFANGDLRYLTRSRDGRWTVEIVDAFNTVGDYTSIALDAQGNPHIAYHDVTNGNLKYASRPSGSWVIETVDASGNDVGVYASLALDPAGNPHIAYRDETVDDLLYATKSSGGMWTTEIVASVGDVGQYASIEVDERYRVHIAFRDVTNTDLRYATKAPGTAWALETADGAGGAYGSLALDAQGRPRIAYQNSVNALGYATRDDGVWSLETASAASSNDIALVIDASGNPKVAYRDIGQSDLRFASKSGSTWTIETVDFGSDVGNYISIALDPQGNPAISYRDNTTWNLAYAESGLELLSPLGGERWAAGSQQTVRWRGSGPVALQLSDNGGESYTTLVSSVIENALTITVPALTTVEARLRISRSSPFSTSDSPGYFLIAPDLVNPWFVEDIGEVNGGSYSSLALDRQDNPHVSYYEFSNRYLKYASKSGSTWIRETVDGAGNVGEYSSLALDLQGNPHISYYENAPNYDLKYASKSGGIWTLETVDVAFDAGWNTSLVLDAQGNPHISYYDGSNKRIKYASKSGGIWTVEIVDANGVLGQYTSLALDAQGNPRISYYDFANSDLKFASKFALAPTWTIETVDADGSVGSFPSLALDAQGNPCISYGANGRLKYASKSGGVWSIEIADPTWLVTSYTSLALDAQGNPHIGYLDNTGRLKHASRSGGIWFLETEDAAGANGSYVSLVLDAHGNPRVAYEGYPSGQPAYASAAIELAEPSPGATWPVGASRTVTWNGTGRVDLSLSTDGGSSWQLLESGLTQGEYRMVVPHTPSKFARLKLERAVPRSVSITPGLFTVQTDIALLSFTAAPRNNEVLLTWATNPGSQDLQGYRLEKRWGGSAWSPLVALTRESSYRDPDLLVGSHYRLFGINGLGQELLLGETSLGLLTPLAAGPLPYRRGSMNVTFASDGGSLETDVGLYDLQGRRVRTLARGRYPVGFQSVTWDGRDEGRTPVASGGYFLRLSDGGRTVALRKIVVAR